MGCFSYLCKKCGKAINSDSQSGERCVILYIEDGKVVEKMTGQYDSYGRVFSEELNPDPLPEHLSHAWACGWRHICTTSQSLDGINYPDKSGLVMFHEECFPEALDADGWTVSSNDPDQGWNEYVRSDDWSSEHVVYLQPAKRSDDEYNKHYGPHDPNCEACKKGE